MKTAVLLLAGLPGAGKSEAAEFFRTKGYDVIRMGELTDRELRRKGKRKTEENEAKIRVELRRAYGKTVYARFACEKILSAASKKTFVIEGVRSPEECSFFKRQFPDMEIIWIESRDSTRFERLQKRNIRPLTVDEAQKRDLWENRMKIRTIKDRADYVIENKGTLEDLHRKLQQFVLPSYE